MSLLLEKKNLKKKKKTNKKLTNKQKNKQTNEKKKKKKAFQVFGIPNNYYKRHGETFFMILYFCTTRFQD